MKDCNLKEAPTPVETITDRFTEPWRLRPLFDYGLTKSNLMQITVLPGNGDYGLTPGRGSINRIHFIAGLDSFLSSAFL